MAVEMGYYLLVVSDRYALEWILSLRRMAFAPSRYRTADRLTSGDQLLLYTTRSCFGNPTRDRGRIIAPARISSELARLADPPTFGSRTFTRGCDLDIEALAPMDEGPELGPLVGKLRTFPSTWRIHIRRTLVPLDEHDFEVLRLAVADVARPLAEALPTYHRRIHPNARRVGRTP